MKLIGIEPRDYQIECATKSIDTMQASGSAISVLPTGTGKTVAATMVIAEYLAARRRAIVMVHSDELLGQWARTIERRLGVPVGLESAQLRAGDEPVVVATVQTLAAKAGDGRRYERFKPNEFGLVVADEAHRSLSPIHWAKPLGHFVDDGGAHLLGITATPGRGDKRCIVGERFGTIAYQMTLGDAWDWGWLVRPRLGMARINELDVSKIRKTAGDLNASQAEAAVAQAAVVQAMCREAVSRAKDQKFIVFCQGVHHVEVVCDALANEFGISAMPIHGGLSKQTRESTMHLYAQDRIQCLVNCMVLVEGWDDPGTSMACMMRQTLSDTVYRQQAGRVMRPLPGVVDGLPDAAARLQAIATSAKPTCSLLDYVGNHDRFDLRRGIDLILADDSDDDTRKRKVEIQNARLVGKSAGGGSLVIEDAVSEAEDAVETADRKVLEIRRNAEAAKSYADKIRMSVTWRDPFAVLSVRKPPSATNMAYRRKPTGAMVSALSLNGVDGADQLEFRQAAKLLAELRDRRARGLCSFKMAKMLKRHGHPVDVTTAKARTLLGLGDPKVAVQPTSLW